MHDNIIIARSWARVRWENVRGAYFPLEFFRSATLGSPTNCGLFQYNKWACPQSPMTANNIGNGNNIATRPKRQKADDYIAADLLAPNGYGRPCRVLSS